MAREMEREEFDIPLMIGGATTSKVHTAVKIAPGYHRGPVVHVVDASRAVGVASQLLSDERHDDFVAEIAAEYAAIRESREGRTGQKPLASLAEARANRLKLDWATYTPPVDMRAVATRIRQRGGGGALVMVTGIADRELLAIQGLLAPDFPST